MFQSNRHQRMAQAVRRAVDDMQLLLKSHYGRSALVIVVKAR